MKKIIFKFLRQVSTSVFAFILFLFFFLLSSNSAFSQCSDYDCNGTSLAARFPSSTSCQGCMEREVEFYFAPTGGGEVNNNDTEFQTCHLKIKGRIEVASGNGGTATLIGLCKSFKDKNNNVINVETNGNEFEVKDDKLIHTFEKTTPLQPDKFAFSLRIIATPGTVVNVILYRNETTMHNTLNHCDQEYSDFCYLAQNCIGNQPVDYVFNYTVGGANSCSNPPLEYYIDYNNPTSFSETEATYGVYIKNNSSTSIPLKEATFILTQQILTGNTICEINGVNTFRVTSIGNGSYRFDLTGNALIPGLSNYPIADIKISAPLPKRLGKVNITYKANSGYMKYIDNSTEQCCLRDVNSGAVKLNDGNAYPSCNNQNLSLRIRGELIDSKTAKLTLYAKSKTNLSLNHAWINLRLFKPSTWAITDKKMNLCNNAAQSCSYSHSISSSNCVSTAQDQVNNDLWYADFGFCTPANSQNLIKDVETEIGYIVFTNATACSSDQISIEPVYVQLGSSPEDPCVPIVSVEGFPLKGKDYIVSGYMNLRCSGGNFNPIVSGINLYEKAGASCNGDCLNAACPGCFSAEYEDHIVDENTLYYDSGQCEDVAPEVTIQPCKSDEAHQFVSTADLVAINKHILGILRFNEFQQYFAADVNHDKSVSTADMSKIRKLILYVDQDFSPYDYWSWRFIPSYHTFDISGQFPSPNDPAACWETKYGTKFSHNYYAIKIGDVNNCKPIIVGNSPMSSNSDRPNYQTGDPVKIKVKANGAYSLEGLQLGLRFNPAHLNYIGFNQTTTSTPILITDPDNIGSTQATIGKLRCLWFDPQGNSHTFQSGEDIIELNFTALQPIYSTSNLVQLDNTVLESLGFNSASEQSNISLDGQFGFTSSGEERENTTFKQTTFGFELMEAEVIPNPSSNQVVLKVKTPEAGMYSISVVDETGKLFLDYKREMERGVNKYTMEGAENLPSGMFYYRVVAPSGSSIIGKLLRQ